MRKLYLHIGTEKTGSTSIQRFLEKNSQTLLARYGILYPMHPALFSNHAHFPLAASFLNPARCGFVNPDQRSDPDSLKQILIDAFDSVSATSMVISAEHFSSRFRPDTISALSETLRPFDVTVIVYLRDQVEAGPSSFATQVKRGRRHWFRTDEVVPENYYLDLRNMVDAWADAFGKDNVRVRIFDKGELIGGSIFQDFMSLLGIVDLSGLSEPEKLNVSPSIKQLKLLVEFNQSLPTWEEALEQGAVDRFSRAQKLRTRILALTHQLDSFSRGPGVDRMLSPKDRRTIAERFRHDNDLLAETYVGRDHLFEVERKSTDTRLQTGPHPDNEITKLDYQEIVLTSLERLHETEKVRDSLRSELANLRKERAALAQAVASLRSQRDAAVDEIEDILNSASWKITSPLRTLTAKIRRVLDRA